MVNERICENCGTALAADAPRGLCPACLMKVAMATGSGADIGGGERKRFVPPDTKELSGKFPQLEILELIGCGGMGAVYKARQPKLDRIVALKILPPDVSHDPAFAERFAREAKALAKLHHPNIVTLYEFGESSGQFYFLMEHVDGLNLGQLLKAGNVAPKEALAIVPQICDALQYAHDHGIVHRDIKPENILLNKAGQVKIADFGVAKIVGGDAVEMAAESAAPGSQSDGGKVVGTARYMAPEQFANPRDVDHRADIYALGVVFYQMLTGELPAGKFVLPSRKVHIDVRLDDVVLRALDREPERRFQQVSEMKTRVETIVQSPPAGVPQPAAAIDLTPRFSRTAIWGGAWVMLFAAVVPAFLAHEFETHEFMNHGPFSSVLAAFAFFVFELPAFLGPLGATMLGWIAVTQIKRSAGRRYGMWLAVFDGLLFPLLSLDLALSYVVVEVAKKYLGPMQNNEPIQPVQIVLLSVAVSVFVDYFVVRAVWRAVNATAERRGRRWVGAAAATAVLVGGVLLARQLGLPPKGAEGLEGDGTWAVEFPKETNPATVKATPGNQGNKLIEADTPGGKKDKFMFGRSGQTLDLSGSSEMNFRVMVPGDNPLKYSVAFVNAAGEFHESRQFTVLPGTWTNQTLKIDEKAFKAERNQFKDFKLDLQGRDEIEKIIFIVYGQVARSVYIDGLAFSPEQRVVKADPEKHVVSVEAAVAYTGDIGVYLDCLGTVLPYGADGKSRVAFSIPQSNVPKIAEKVRAKEPVTIKIHVRNWGIIAEGQIESLADQIDSNTGTLVCKAVVTESKEILKRNTTMLYPGGYVDVRVRVDTSLNTTLVPQKAVRMGDDGNYVRVINPDRTVEKSRKVTVGSIDGDGPPMNTAEIVSGLKPGEIVVLDSQPLKAGAHVIYALTQSTQPATVVELKRAQQTRIMETISSVGYVESFAKMDIFEPSATVFGEYRLRKDVSIISLRRDDGPSYIEAGRIYYLPGANRYFIQWQPDSESRAYYGPFDGNPASKLGLSVVPQKENSEDRYNRINGGRPNMQRIPEKKAPALSSEKLN